MTPTASTPTGLPAGPVADNLVLRAAAVLRRHVARPLPPLEFGLAKVVPVAAGLGGGSSDAAAAMTIAARAWGVTLDRATRLALAAMVGSDVPFFALGAAAAWATGRGERLTALPAPVGAPACVLAVTREGVATAADLRGLRPAPAAARRRPRAGRRGHRAPGERPPRRPPGGGAGRWRRRAARRQRPVGRARRAATGRGAARARAWRPARGGRGCSRAPGRPSSLCMLPSRRHVRRSRRWAQGRPAGATACG